MTGYLLDVNLLLALLDPRHVHSELAHEWFASQRQLGWATSSITENGFIRIAGNPKYLNVEGGVVAAIDILRRFTEVPDHRFWGDAVSIRNLLSAGVPIAHSQITDVYLLGLAVHHGGKLATLDARIPANAVRGGTEALELVH